MLNNRLSAIILVTILALAAGISAQGTCFPAAEQTFVKLTTIDPSGASADATLNAYLYYVNSTSQKRESVPINQGLIIVDWGGYPTKTCYMVTNEKGSASATLDTPVKCSAASGTCSDGNYPSEGQSLTYTATFCPFVANHTSPTAVGPEWMANCARLRDIRTNDQNTVKRLDYATIPLCPGAASAAPYMLTVNSEERDYGDFYQPSTAFITIRNSMPSMASNTFCWGLAAVFGLLFSAMFIAGRNPFYMLDMGNLRNTRMNRASGYYTMMSQQVSVAPVAIARAVDGMVGAGIALGSSQEEDGAKEENKDAMKQAKNANEDLKDAKADRDEVYANPKATANEKKAADAKVTAANETVKTKGAVVTATGEKLAAAKELTAARKSGDKTRISAAESKYNEKSDNLVKIGGGPLPNVAQKNWNRQSRADYIERKANYGYLSGMVGTASSNLLGKEDAAKWMGIKNSMLSNMVNKVVQNTTKHLVISFATKAVGKGLGKSTTWTAADFKNAATVGLVEGAKDATAQIAVDLALRGVHEACVLLRGPQGTDKSQAAQESNSDLAEANKARQKKIEEVKLESNAPGPMTEAEANAEAEKRISKPVRDPITKEYVITDTKTGTEIRVKNSTQERIDRQEVRAEELKANLIDTYKKDQQSLNALDPTLKIDELPKDFDSRFIILPNQNGDSQVVYTPDVKIPMAQEYVLLGGVHTAPGASDVAYIATAGGQLAAYVLPSKGETMPPISKLNLVEVVDVRTVYGSLMTPGGLIASTNPAVDFLNVNMYHVTGDKKKYGETPGMKDAKVEIVIAGQQITIEGKEAYTYDGKVGTTFENNKLQVGTFEDGKLTLDTELTTTAGGVLASGTTYELGKTITREDAKEQRAKLEIVAEEKPIKVFGSDKNSEITIEARADGANVVKEGDVVKAIITHDGEGKITSIREPMQEQTPISLTNLGGEHTGTDLMLTLHDIKLEAEDVKRAEELVKTGKLFGKNESFTTLALDAKGNMVTYDIKRTSDDGLKITPLGGESFRIKGRDIASLDKISSGSDGAKAQVEVNGNRIELEKTAESLQLRTMGQDIDSFALKDGTMIEIDKHVQTGSKGKSTGPDQISIRQTDEVAGNSVSMNEYYRQDSEVEKMVKSHLSYAFTNIARNAVSAMWTSKPPRLGEMGGNAWNVTGLALTDYLTNPIKYAQGIQGYDKNAMQQMMQLQQQIMLQQQRK